MTKAEFLKALEEKLSALSAEDRAASLAYYEEIIDDRMEEGLCEADAVAAAGPVEEAAAQLLAETPHAETRLCAQPKQIEPAGSFLLFTDPFDAVEIHAACADVELRPSEDGVCRVEFQEEQRCAASVAGGILRIQELRRHRVGLTLDLSIGGRQLFNVPMPDNTLRVYLPVREYRRLDAETRSGEIEVAGGLAFGRAALRSASGDVEIYAAVRSELRVHTASGDIEVKSAAPETMELETASGDVALSGCGRAAVTVKTASGDVEFEDCEEAMLTVSTASGDIDGDFSRPHAVEARSVSGDVDVPEGGAGPACCLRSVSGDIKVRIR